MFWSLVSGIPIWVAFEVLLLWSFASDKIEIFTFSDGWIWFCLWFPLLQIWQSFHFYWWHRMLHIPFFYKIAHAVHHRNINPGPWSGYSMHPIEHTFFISSLLIHFVIPSHPLHILYHLYWLVLGTVSTHSGYEKIWVKEKNLLTVGSFFIISTIDILIVIMEILKSHLIFGLEAIMTAVKLSQIKCEKNRFCFFQHTWKACIVTIYF